MSFLRSQDRDRPQGHKVLIDMSEIDDRIQQLIEELDSLREMMPVTPLDAEKKAMQIGLIEEELAELYEQKQSSVTMKPADRSKDELTEEIKSITDELMELEIKMIKAEMENNEDERIKLQMCASTLKSRRQALIDEVKEMNSAPMRDNSSGLERRVSDLEKEVADIKALLYRILTKD